MDRSIVRAAGSRAQGVERRDRLDKLGRRGRVAAR